MNRESLGDISLSHVVFETKDLARGKKFYTEALGLKFVGELDNEHFFAFGNHQLLAVKLVDALSDRTKRMAGPFTWHLMLARKISTGCSSLFRLWRRQPGRLSL